MVMYAVTLALSVARFPRYFDTPMRYLPILFAYTLLTETIGLIIRDSDDFSIVIHELYYNNNWLIFNIYLLIYFGFFFYIYHRYITTVAFRGLKIAGLGFFIAVCIFNAWQYDFTTVSQVWSFWAGSLVTGVMAVLYLMQEWRYGDRPRLKHNLLIWLSLGFLIFNLGYMVVRYLKFLVVHDGMEYYGWIHPLYVGLIYVEYACFITGLVLMHKMRQPGCPVNGIYLNGNRNGNGNENRNGNGIKKPPNQAG